MANGLLQQLPVDALSVLDEEDRILENLEERVDAYVIEKFHDLILPPCPCAQSCETPR